MNRIVSEQAWSKDLKSIYSKYPAIIRSTDWPEVRRLANRGDYAGAEELAKKAEGRNFRLRVENVIARRMRVERASLFVRLSKSERELRDVFRFFGKKLAIQVEKRATGPGNLRFLYQAIHDAVYELARRVRVIVNATVRDSVQMGLKNAGAAFMPIFKDNWESILQEEKLSFGLDTSFANRTDPRVNLASAKWRNSVTRIVLKQAKKNVKGQNYSERIWDLRTRMEAQLKRTIVNEIAKGTSPQAMARKVEKYLSPRVLSREDYDEPMGPGVYASPFKNAWRLTRTEAGKAYTAASAEFARDKDWITGVRVTLSPAHAEEDICDDLADGEVLTPDEFEDLIPAHPHCMCYPTYVLKDEFLTGLEGEEEE